MLLQVALIPSFLWPSNIPLCVYIYIPHLLHPFTPSSTDEYLGCFQVWAIVNSAAVNTAVHVSFLFSFFFFFRATHMASGSSQARLGVESELQLPAYATATVTATAMLGLSCVCDLHHSWWQCLFLNPLSTARDQTSVFMDTSWACNPLSHMPKFPGQGSNHTRAVTEAAAVTMPDT